ncbi:MAG: fibrobacter succinogenes major paralogous domain-containing protein [Chitinophagaceae bacterium]|jgi:uncharacterized protein (TIGR02145 family)
MKSIVTKIAFTLIVVGAMGICNSTSTFAQGTPAESITDAEGNSYRTIKIGNQTWMVDNLRTTKYNDGAPIATASEIGDLRKTTMPAYSVHNNGNANYGHLYNWYAVNTGKLAPKGWHIPTKQDWDLLLNYLGGFSKAGDKMKSTSWSPNGMSGFDAMPAGFLANSGMFANVGNAAFWWSTRERNAAQADYVKIMSSLPSALSNGAVKQFFMSVRCVKN